MQTQEQHPPKDNNQNEAESCMGIEHAIKRFEKIMMQRIYLQQRLGDRLKLSIRTGMLVLLLLAVAMLLLIVTLSIQVSQVAAVADNMNQNFYTIAKNMQTINRYMDTMETQVAFLPKIKNKTAVMDLHMHRMNQNMSSIKTEIQQMTGQLSHVQQNMVSISKSVNKMDAEVGLINAQVHRMSKPANTVNKMFPF
jgi:methyl-accepting chemotaxis protein